MVSDPYKVLGLSPGASDEEVKAAVKKICRCQAQGIFSQSEGSIFPGLQFECFW